MKLEEAFEKIKQMKLSKDSKEMIIEMSLIRAIIYEGITEASVKLMGEMAGDYLSDYSVREHLHEAEIEKSYSVLVNKETSSDTCQECGCDEFLCGHNKKD